MLSIKGPSAYNYSRNSKVVAQCLLDAKADLNAQNKEQQTPLFMAAAADFFQLVTFFLKRGATIDPNTKGISLAILFDDLNIRMEHMPIEIQHPRKKYKVDILGLFINNGAINYDEVLPKKREEAVRKFNSASASVG